MYPQPVHGANRTPVVTHAQGEFDQTGPGGAIVQMRAATALNIGDCVYVDANGEVAKSTTAANYAAFAGVVVGGRSTNMRAHIGTASGNDALGDAACAAADQTVLVQINGIAWVKAAAATVRGSRVGVVTTAGQIDDSVTTYQIGVCLDTAGAGGVAVRLLMNGVTIEL